MSQRDRLKQLRAQIAMMVNLVDAIERRGWEPLMQHLAIYRAHIAELEAAISAAANEESEVEK